MELKYVGPKSIISHTGIEFDNNKEDKYIYLHPVVELLKALDHEYDKDKIYKYNVNIHGFCNDELYKEMKKYCPNIHLLMQDARDTIEDKINHSIKRIQVSRTLTDIEKETFLNNLEMVNEYIIQRFINKSVYYYAVDALGKRVIKYHLDYVIAPMFQKFDHVLHSLQGVLLKSEYSRDTKLDIYEEDTKLFVKLEIL